MSILQELSIVKRYYYYLFLKCKQNFFFVLVTNKNKLYFAYPKHVVHRRDPKRAFRDNPFNCIIVSVGRTRRTNTY